MTAVNMIIASGEFRRIDQPKRFACYSGVAPFEHRSGTSYRGKTRISKMGNMTLKRHLHLAAMAAVKSTSDLKEEYYYRKLKEGKNKTSSINAVRNKLIARVYSCVQNERLYQKTYINQLA
jgi:transposase